MKILIENECNFIRKKIFGGCLSRSCAKGICVNNIGTNAPTI